MMTAMPGIPPKLEDGSPDARDAASFRILVEQISDYAIFMLDPNGLVISWNLGAERIKGYRREEILGRPQRIFYSADDQAAGKPQAFLRKAELEGTARDIGWRVRKDGSRFCADVTLTSLHDPDGKLYGYAKVTRDLTERMVAEERERAHQATRESLQLRDEFISIAAHELRTPLTAGMLHLHTVQRHVARDPARWDFQRVRSGIQLARQNCERLAQLIDSLLDVTGITSGHITLEPTEFDLTEATAPIVEHFQEAASTSGCELRLKPSAPIHGCWDRLRIEQALINLISNAIKYAPGSLIEVALAQTGERVRLSVEDHGPGVARENQERIFSRFERAESLKSQTGLGLGLYVTRQIAELHGGSAYVHSEPGAGSTFVIDLPLNTPKPGNSNAG